MAPCVASRSRAVCAPAAAASGSYGVRRATQRGHKGSACLRLEAGAGRVWDRRAQAHSRADRSRWRRRRQWHLRFHLGAGNRLESCPVEGCCARRGDVAVTALRRVCSGRAHGGLLAVARRPVRGAGGAPASPHAIWHRHCCPGWLRRRTEGLRRGRPAAFLLRGRLRACGPGRWTGHAGPEVRGVRPGHTELAICLGGLGGSRTVAAAVAVDGWRPP